MTFLQLFEGDLETAALVWDDHRDRVLAVRRGQWRTFGSVGEAARELRDDGVLTVSPSPATCVDDDLFMDSEGSFVYAVARSCRLLRAFAFEPSGNVRHVQTLEIEGLEAALITNDDADVYAITERSLLAFERDTETGELGRVNTK